MAAPESEIFLEHGKDRGLSSIAGTGSADSIARREMLEMCLLIALASVAFFLVFFKFVPDAGTVYFANMVKPIKAESDLVSFDSFRLHYLSPDSVNYPRFLGNIIVYKLANFIGSVFSSSDPRLDPLRLAAIVIVCISFYIAALPAMMTKSLYNWKVFFCLFSFMCLIGQYVYYPGDMTSLAFLSLSLYSILREKFVLAALFMAVTGLFRESAFHVVYFMLIWAVCDGRSKVANRAAIVLGFAAVFFLEYKLIRVFFPGPLSVVPNQYGISTSISEMLFDRGLWSLTTVATLAIDVLFCAYYFLTRNSAGVVTWRDSFFLLNCLSLPFWIIFYRMLGGNINEFRLLFPALLPIVYGVAYNLRDETHSLGHPERERFHRPSPASHNASSPTL